MARARPGSARDTAWETAVWAAGGGGAAAAASAPRARGDRGSRRWRSSQHKGRRIRANGRGIGDEVREMQESDPTPSASGALLTRVGANCRLAGGFINLYPKS